jgi:hypothetical protein
VDQVATNYSRLLPFLDAAGIMRVSYIRRSDLPRGKVDGRFRFLEVEHVELNALRPHLFWKSIETPTH